jgi:hypothetical protein
MFGGSKGSGGFAGIQTMMTWYVCHMGRGRGGRMLIATSISKCATDSLGIDVSALSSGTMPTNIPCADKLPGTLTMTT